MRLVVGLMMVVLAVSACTKSSSKGAPASSGPSTPTPTASIVVPKGDYGYSSYGITASLKPAGSGWSLEVTNKSGEKVGGPSIYALAATDGKRVQATVESPTPLANGQSGTFTVTFPSGFDSRTDVGLMLLVLGQNNYGAFVHG